MGGRKSTGIDAIWWVKRAEELGAGEILLNSMDADGTREGFDLEMIKAVRREVKIPIIASGGAGKADDVGILQLDDALVKLPVAGAEGGDLFIVFRPFSLELYNLRVHFFLLSVRSGRGQPPVCKEMGLPIA